MQRIQCRNCECSQEPGPTCRRCGRAIPGYRAPEPVAPPPAPEPPPPPVIAERVVIVAADASKTFAEIEQLVILARVAHYRGNIVRAALSLGIGKTTLYRKLAEYQASSQNGTKSSEPGCNQSGSMQR